MKKVTFDIVEFKYKTPLPVKGTLILANNFLRIRNDDSEIYFSVLNGLHQTNLDIIESCLKNMINQINKEFDINLSKKYLDLLNPEIELDNNLTFFIESFLLFLKDHNAIKTNYTIKRNELYSSSKKISDYKSSDVLKIKISKATNTFDLIILLKDLILQNPLIKFRFDANRSLNTDDLIQIYTALDDANLKNYIDYFEEPLSDFSMYSMESISDIPIAFDESFHSHKSEVLSLDNPIVIKPTLIGLSEVYNLLHLYPLKRFIISSTFDHPTILQILEYLASFKPHEYHGIQNELALK